MDQTRKKGDTAALESLPRWVRWRLHEGRKIPTPSIKEPGLPFKQVADSPRKGFVFHREDGFVFIDLDGARDPRTGATLPWAQPILEEAHLAGLYVQSSVSGCGWHVIGRGSRPSDIPTRSGDKQTGGIEVYDDARFVAMTFENASGSASITVPDEVWDAIRDAPVSRPKQSGGVASSMLRSEKPHDLRIDGCPPYALEALRRLDAQDYASWIAVGHALKAEGLDFEIWDAWSRTAPNYDRSACLKKWDTFRPHSVDIRNLRQAAGLSTAALDFGEDWRAIGAAEAAEEAPSHVSIIDIITGWNPRSAADFLIEQPVDFVVDGLIQSGQVGLINAPGSTGKTALSLYLHCCIRAGLPFFGRKVKKGRTFFLSMDDSQKDLDTAMARLVKGNPYFKGHEEEIRNGGLLISLRGLPLLSTSLVGVKDRMYETSSFARELLYGLKKRAAVEGGFVFGQLDTVRQFNAADSNDEGAAKAFMQAAFMLTTLPGNPSILAPHHVSKAAGRAKIDDMYSSYGTNAYADNARFGFNLFQLTPDEVAKEVKTHEGEALPIDGEIFRLSPTRGSLCVKKADPLYYQRKDWEFVALNVSRITAADRKSGLIEQIVQFIESYDPEEYNGRPCSKRIVVSAVGGKTEAVSEAIDEAIKLGLITNAGKVQQTKHGPRVSYDLRPVTAKE